MNQMIDQRREAQEKIRRSKEAGRQFLLEAGLYDSIEASKCPEETFKRIEAANLGTFDCYCVDCKKETPFICQEHNTPNRGGGLRNNNALVSPPSVFAVRSVCQRCLKTYFYVFRREKETLTKIGQLPSIADIAFSELKEIDTGLKDGDRKELGKALGLYAHGAALGGFAYLRRVFERMIVRAHERMVSAGREVEGFEGLKMADRIKSVSEELPDAVVAQKGVFAVLSLGLHELDEEKCKELFPLMKAVIFQMLEQEEHLRKKAKSERDTAAALSKVLSNGLKGKSEEATGGDG